MRTVLAVLMITLLSISSLFASAEKVSVEAANYSTRISRTVLNNGDRQIDFNWPQNTMESWINEVMLDTDALLEGEMPVSYRSLIPAPRGYTFTIKNFEYSSTVPLPDDLQPVLDIYLSNNPEIASIGQRVIFRDIAATPLEISPFVKINNLWNIATDVRVNLEKVFDGGDNPTSTGIAPSFLNAYSQFLTDGELDELGEVSSSGGYIVIANSIYHTHIADWVEWKRECGYPVQVIEVDDNPAYGVVAGLISDAYYETEPRPEFVLLVGDPNIGSATIPGDHVASAYPGWPQVITDHHYVTLEGDDEFPEMWIGRWSVTAATTARTIANKTMAYEQGYNLDQDATWLEHALLVCDTRFNSTAITTSWIRRQLLGYGYTQVDSVIYPPTIGHEEINGFINDGVGVVNYRGFGSPGTWSMPIYSSENVAQLTNSYKTPIVTSIVCGGGAFDHPTDPCLGEAFIRAGSPTTLKGGVAFTGPSELDTHTKWNNCMDMGIYHGLIYENIQQFGPLVFRGKMSVWNGFPNNREPGNSTNSARFYFDCYNVLGDPGLLIRTREPIFLDLNVATVLEEGSNDLMVQVLDEGAVEIPNANVTVYADGWGPFSVISDNNGIAHFDFTGNLPPAGDFTVTAHGFNMVPVQSTVTVQQTAFAVSLDELQTSAPLTPGSTVNLTPILINSGTEYQGAMTGTLEVFDDNVTIVTATQNYTELGNPGNQAAALSYQISIGENMVDGFDPGARLTLVSGGNTCYVHIPIEISAPKLAPVDPVVSAAEIGESVTFAPEFINLGSITADEPTITISTTNPNVSIITNSTTLPEIDPDGTSQTGTDLEISSNLSAFRGEALPVQWTAEYTNGRIETGTFNFIPGEKTVDDPYGPDEYGYRAFDNTDAEYWDSPTYSWQEIAPSLGGPGTSLDLYDIFDEADTSTYVVLPFDMVYYGDTHNGLTICSNGWLKPGNTHEKNFRNWNMIAGPGPTNMIAPFWDDLLIGNVGVSYFYDEVGGRFIVEWSNMLHNNGNPNDLVSCQAIIYDPEVHPTPTGDSVIEFYYQEATDTDTNENYCSIGLRNQDSHIGLELTYASHGPDEVNPVDAGRAYRFTTSQRPNGIAIKSTSITLYDDGQFGSIGNGNGRIDNGETIAASVTLRNFGTEDASNVVVNLNIDDEDVSVLQGNLNIGDLAARTSVAATSQLVFSVNYEIPDQHFIPLELNISADGGSTWSEMHSLETFAPAFRLAGWTMDDSNGNGDGFVQAGEDIELTVNLENFGRNAAGDIDVTISPIGDHSTINSGSASVDTMASGDLVTLDPDFSLTIAENVEDYQELRYAVDVYIHDLFSTSDTLTMRVGIVPFYETFESDDWETENWRLIQGIWHRSTYDYRSAFHSLRWGYEMSDGYPANRADMIISEGFILDGVSTLELWTEYDFGIGDYMLIRVSYVGNSLVTVDSLYGTSSGWERLQYELDPPEPNQNTAIFLRTYSDIWDEGAGAMIDDISIFAGGLEVENIESAELPDQFELGGPYPNPFNPAAHINFALPEAEKVKISVYDILGREVATLVDKKLTAGYYNVSWDASDFASGIYFIHMQAKDFKSVKKAVMIK